ncbi:hypothetical protein [Pedobacter sp. N23S346]|uniref:hypothetical protein n=1 Tax=Pedobacter sp. N23S346 TaxID=3402750 RepID=UPI003ACC61F0
MKNFFYLSAIVLFCSCNSETKESKEALVQTPNGINGLQKNIASPAAQSTKSALIYNPVHGKPGHTCALAVGAPLNQTIAAQPQKNTTTIQPVSLPAPTPVNTSVKKLNPKHGEPDHRCDIAVGAPLDSKPVALATAISSQPKAIQPSSVKVAKGMNPAHGQPNHRCDIAVGAPLNSKAITTPSAVAVKTPDVKATDTKIIETTQNGVKLNPKHGDPGHRCDIAVGAPLT